MPTERPKRRSGTLDFEQRQSSPGQGSAFDDYGHALAPESRAEPLASGRSRSVAKRWGLALLELLLEYLSTQGTNRWGFILFLSVPLGLMAIFKELQVQVPEPVFNLAMGSTYFLIDAGLRKACGHESILKFDRGARLLFLPLWLWGLVCIALGLGRLLWGLIT